LKTRVLTEWREYARAYRGFEDSMASIHLMTAVATATLEGQEWPEHIAKMFSAAMRDVTQMVTTGAQVLKESRRKSPPRRELMPGPEREDEVYQAFHHWLVMLMWAQTMFPRAKAPRRSFAYGEILRRSHLVLVVAHLEAFLADSVRAACRARPEVLHTDRTFKWSDILAAGSWNGVLSSMIEAYVLELGMLSLKARITKLRERHLKLPIKVPARVLIQLDEAENVRNAWLHDGGRASARFIERSGRTDIVLGSDVPMVNITTTALNARWLAAVVFRDISSKFLGRTNLDDFPSFTPGKTDDATSMTLKWSLGGLRGFIKKIETYLGPQKQSPKSPAH
jgi:hypothetical protein